jgi:hypothetical protein
MEWMEGGREKVGKRMNGGRARADKVALGVAEQEEAKGPERMGDFFVVPPNVR